MTNEQKTKELVQTWCNNKYFARDVYNAVMDMAEWKEKQIIELWNVARNVYEAWMGGTMNDVRECMKDLGHVYDEFKDKGMY